MLALYEDFYKDKQAKTRGTTLQTYQGLRDHLESFAGRNAALARIGPAFLDDFVTHLLQAGLGNATVNKLASRLKGFLKWLHKRELLDAVPQMKPLPTVRNRALYITEDELRRLIDLDLEEYQPGYSAARDLFVAECVTGQRISDLLEMTWPQLDMQGWWWHKGERKTRVVRRIPLPAPIRRIIESRTGEPTPLPRLSNQKANRYIKEVCRLAGIDTPVTIQVLRGGVRETITRPKWEAMTTHVGRKTFVTLFLQAGHNPTDLLGLSHDDLRTLQHYAGQDDRKRKQGVETTFGGL